MAYGSAGLALIWSGSLGTAVAWMRSATAVAPDWSGHVGAERQGVGRPAIAFAGSDSLVATWCESDGGHVEVLRTSDGGVVSGPFALFPNTRATAIATRGRDTMVVAVDDDGLVARWAVRPDSIGSAPLVRIVSQRGLDPVLAATDVGDGWLVAYSLASEGLFGVCVVRRGSPRDVRHRLSAPIAALHASSAGTTAAVVLAYEGRDAERVDLALVTAEGNLSQRPHVVLEDLGARFVAPHVHFIESGFVVAAIEESEGALWLSSEVGRGRTGLTSLPIDVAIGCYAERIVATGVGETDGETRLVRASCDPSGGRGSIGTIAFVPDDAPLRLSRSRSRQMLIDVGTRIAGPAYRSAESVVEVATERLEIELRRAGTSARVRVEPDEASTSWSVTLAAWRDWQTDAPAPTPSIVRLLRWVRARVSAEAQRATDAAEAWAERIAKALDGASIERLDWVDGARAVKLTLGSLPSSEATSLALTRAIEW